MASAMIASPVRGGDGVAHDVALGLASVGVASVLDVRATVRDADCADGALPLSTLRRGKVAPPPNEVIEDECLVEVACVPLTNVEEVVELSDARLRAGWRMEGGAGSVHQLLQGTGAGIEPTGTRRCDSCALTATSPI